MFEQYTEKARRFIFGQVSRKYSIASSTNSSSGSPAFSISCSAVKSLAPNQKNYPFSSIS